MLKPRIRAHEGNAIAIARVLRTHPKVAWMRYPFLASNTAYQVGTAQMALVVDAYPLAEIGFEGAAVDGWA